MHPFLAAIQRQNAHTKRVYGTPLVGMTVPGALHMSAAQRRRNPKLWTAADRKWWLRLTPARRLHHAYCIGWSRYGEALESGRAQARETALRNFEGVRRVFLQKRHERRIETALRLHRPVRNLRDALRYRWYLDPDWREGEEVHG